jgi:hypothetical protein
MVKITALFFREKLGECAHEWKKSHSWWDDPFDDPHGIMAPFWMADPARN